MSMFLASHFMHSFNWCILVESRGVFSIRATISFIISKMVRVKVYRTPPHFDMLEVKKCKEKRRVSCERPFNPTIECITTTGHFCNLKAISYMLHGAGIFTNICPKNHPNVGKYIIHRAYGFRKKVTLKTVFSSCRHG